MLVHPWTTHFVFKFDRILNDFVLYPFVYLITYWHIYYIDVVGNIYIYGKK